MNTNMQSINRRTRKKVQTTGKSESYKSAYSGNALQASPLKEERLMSLGRTGNNRTELLFTERINIKQAFKLGVAMILWDRQGLYVFFDRQDLESLVVVYAAFRSRLSI
jgi:hypothetical protein